MGIWDAGKIGNDFDRTVERIKSEAKRLEGDQPVQVPSPGRIVHYVMPISNGQVSCYPAIVKRVRIRNGYDSYMLDLTVFGPEGMTQENIVLYDAAEKRTWTWHWPERVTSDDELLALDRPIKSNDR